MPKYEIWKINLYSVSLKCRGIAPSGCKNIKFTSWFRKKEPLFRNKKTASELKILNIIKIFKMKK